MERCGFVKKDGKRCKHKHGKYSRFCGHHDSGVHHVEYEALFKDFKQCVTCHCCVRHMTNRPLSIRNISLELGYYKKTYGGENPEQDICSCTCRQRARDICRLIMYT